MNAKNSGQSVMHNRQSYSSQEPDLRKGMPISLREMRALRSSFDYNRSPYTARQLRDSGKTEAQRREERAQGSTMVKLHHPFPELRPKRQQGPIRESFNKAWLKERRSAFLFNRNAERLHNKPEKQMPERMHSAPQRGR